MSDDSSVSAVRSDECDSKVDEHDDPTVTETPTTVSSEQDQMSVRESNVQDGFRSRFGRLVKPVNRRIQSMSTQRVHAIHEI